MAADEIDEFEGAGLPDFLRDPLGTLRRRWLWMVVALTAGLAGTAAFVTQQEPLYAATATVLVTSQRIRQDLVRPTVEEDSFQRINALISSLLSLTKLSGLIEQYDLYPELRESLARAEIATRMRENVSIKAVEGLGVLRQESARVFSITFKDRRPEVAATVANELASLFTSESIRIRTQQAGLATNFLRAELERAESELRDQNAAIREFKEAHRGELPGEFEANLMKLERLQQQRQSLALQIAEAENRLILLSSQASAVDSLGNPMALATPEQRLQVARAELESLLAQYTELHPAVRHQRRAIERLEQEAAETPDSEGEPNAIQTAMPAAARRALDELKKQLAATEASLAELDERVSRTPARQEELTALEERESVLRENYLDFLRKVQEAELAQSLEAAQQGARFSISDRAEAPTKPTRARMKYLVLGVVASFGLAVMVGLALEAFDPVLVSSAQIEALGGLPVLGSGPHLA